MRRHFGLLVFMLVFVSAAQASTAENVLTNGDFEAGQEGWALNPVTAPAEIEVLSGQPGVEVHSGRNALLVRTREGNSHIHQPGGKAEVDYLLTFWARGGETLTAAEGTAVRPRVGAGVYIYGRPEEHGGRNAFLTNQLQHNFRTLGTNWQEFRLPIRVSEAEVPGARIFNLFFAIQGEVILDEVALRAVEAWRDSLLFYLPFDEDFEAAVAGGNATPEVRGEVRLVEGRRGKAAAFSDGNHLAFDAPGNFDQAEGTIAMWIRPYWSDHDGVAHRFFEVPGPGEHAANPDAAFVVSKGWLDTNTPNLTYFHLSTANWVWGQHISHMFGFEPNEWVHLAFSWSAAGPLLKVYKNGELVRVGQEPMGARPPSEGRQMIIGARHDGTCGADAVLDEIMIFDRALSDAEVARVAGIDPATVKPAGPPEPMDSYHVNVLEAGPQTPHIPLNRPSAQDPVRALFMVAYTHGQDVVELAQRCALDFAAVISHADRGRFGMDRQYHALWADLSTEAKTREVSARLDEKPEVLVIASLDFTKIPPALQQRIMAMVSEGMGLVLVAPPGLPTGLTQPSEEGRAAILSGVPLAGMQDCYPRDDLASDELGRKMVQAYAHGAGRVVVIHWYDNPSAYDRGMTPRAASGVVDRRFEHRYNYSLSLVGKALQWAAGREPGAEWTSLPQEGQVYPVEDWPAEGLPLRMEWRGAANRAATLHATLRDPAGRITWRGRQETQLAFGANDLTVRLPAPGAGLSYLHLALVAEGRVKNWATVSFRVQRSEEIVSLDTDRRHYEQGETVQGEVRFRAPLPRAAQLLVTATDTYGREYARTSQPLRARARRARFALPLAGTTSLANYVEAQVVRDGEVLARDETVVYTPRPRDSEFQSMMWDIYALPDTMVGHRTHQRIREAGFNALYRWQYMGDFHSEAMADLMPVQYCTRLTARPDADGWLQLPSLHLKLNYGLEDRDHSLANPAMQQVLRERVAAVARHSAPLGPWWYSLGDENWVRRGWGYSPYGLEYFRGFLERRYGDIATLNREHGTNYANFADVPRWRPGAPAADGAIPATLDHELALDDEWAALHQFLAEEIREIDPTARVGAEGSEAGDMERMLQGQEVWAPYAGKGELLRSLGPDKLRSHWWGGYGVGASDAGELWSWLLQGKANFHQFYAATGVDGILNANLTYRDYFMNLLPDLREIDGGLGMLLSGAQVISDRDVVIHYSRQSFHAGAALGKLARAAATDKALLDTLRAMGQDFRYASARLINEGRLLSPRAKVLFLPASFCLSEQEAEGIARFVREGGTVVADTMPGVLNEYGRRLGAGLLDEVFGATGAGEPLRIEDLVVTGDLWEQPVSLGLGVAFCDGSLQTTTGRALKTVDDVPVVVLNEYGQGRALLLNFDLGRAPKAMIAQLVRAALAVADVQPEFRLEGVEGGEVSRGEYSSATLNTVSVLRRGDVTLAGAVLGSERPEEDVSLAWDAPRHAYNVRTGEYLGLTDSVALAPLPPTQFGRRAQAYLLSLHEEPVRGIIARGPGSVAPGGALELTVGVELGSGSPRDRLLRVEVIDSEGRNPLQLRRFVTLSEATTTCTIPFAFNDAQGRWTVRVTDLATGVSADKVVSVR